MRLEYRGAIKKGIVADWAAAFPTLKAHAPATISPRLVRRVGPLLLGISLEGKRDPHVYRPRAFLHLLAEPLGYLTLAGATYPRKDNGAQIEIAAGLHAREYEDAAARLRRQFPLSFDDPPPTVDDVVAGCRTLVARDYSPDSPGTNRGLVGIVVIAPALVGRGDLVRDGLAYAAEISRGWAALGWDRDHWLQSLGERAADPDSLRATVDAEVIALKLTKVPFVELT